MKTIATTATVKNSVNNNKIQDFGQKIGGARKDWFANMKEAAQKFAEVGAVDLIAAPLSKVVALPNLEKMTEAGALSADSARAVLTLWRKIETRPAGSTYRLQRWAAETAPKLARIGAILNGEQITEEERAAVDFQILTAANWPAESFNFGRVKTIRGNSGILYAAAGRYYIAKSNNAADIVEAIRTQNEKDAQKRAEGVRLAICYNRAGEYFVTPEHKTEIILFKGSRAECYDQKANHADELRARYAEIKSVPELRRDWNRPRVGEDWRKGQDITPETFGAVLPFRGVEFGNWVTQAERASLLNSAFDGFQDLAHMLGVSVERVTLGGSLAFAFASRGISKAMAHYEPGRKVINLTKKKGAGCMAHEWFHACDNYAANLGGLHSSFMATEHAADTDAGRCALAISQAIRSTEFYHRSRNMAIVCGSYWVEPCELAARAFEGVCAYMLKRSGVCSDFLVNCLSMDEFTAADTLHRSEIFPYPSEAEAAALVPYYVAFFRALFGEGAELSAEQLADINAQQEKASQERAEAIAKREEAARKLKEDNEAKEKAEAEQRDQERADALAKHRDELPALIAKAESDGVQNVATLVTSSGAIVAGVLGGYILVYWTKYNNTEERAALAYKRNGRLRNGAKVHRLYIESTQQTADEYFQSISASDEMAGYYVGAYGLNALAGYFSQDSATFADILSKAQEAQKRAQERANVAETTNTKAEEEKAAERRENDKKGNRSEIDTTAAPADGLQLVEVSGGVAVVGDPRTTYRNRREIKAHGATWNKTAQRWEATEAEKVAQLRAWFALDEQTTEATAEASTEAGAPAEGQGVEFNAEGLEALRQKFAEMEAKETEEGATDQAPEADTMDAPAEGQEVAESEAVASGAPRYSVCEKSPISEKSGAGSPSSPSFPCWGVFEFGDVDCNSHEPRLANAFDTEDKAREWLQKCADGTGALCADAVDVLACAGGFWMVWYSHRSGGYYCQYVAQRADDRDLSGALLQCESLNLRQRLHDLKREHMARQMAEKVAKLQAGEVYAVDYDGEVVTAENDSANAGRYVVTFWSYGEMKERHTNRTAAEAAQAVADFVAVNVPARVWTSQRCLLHTFKADEFPYYSGSEKSPILQNVETPNPSDYSPLNGEELARAFEKARKLSRSALRTMWPCLDLSSYMMAYAAATDRPFPIMAEAVTAVTTGAQSWTAPDGCTLKLECEQFKEYGESLHLLYYSATGELQEHSVTEFYTEAVKAVCVFVFKHTKSTTDDAVRNEPADLPDGYGVDADRYPVGSVWQYTQRTGSGEFMHEIRKRADHFDLVVNIYNREGDGQRFPDKFPTYAAAYEALIRFRPGSRLCSHPYLSSEAV